MRASRARPCMVRVGVGVRLRLRLRVLSSEAHPLGNAQTSLASRAGLGGWRTCRRHTAAARLAADTVATATASTLAIVSTALRLLPPVKPPAGCTAGSYRATGGDPAVLRAPVVGPAPGVSSALPSSAPG